MGGVASALRNKGDPPPTLNHPREMISAQSMAGRIRITMWRHAWRNNHHTRLLILTGVTVTMFFNHYLMLPIATDVYNMSWWDHKKDIWNEVRELEQNHLQKIEDNKYFDWRDGANPYKKMNLGH
jgi:hypothetical protein